MHTKLLCAAAAALCLSTPAAASTDFSRVFSASTFESKGACERALNRERNARRQAGDVGTRDRYGTYNAWARWYFDCTQIGPKTWVIIRIR